MRCDAVAACFLRGYSYFSLLRLAAFLRNECLGYNAMTESMYLSFENCFYRSSCFSVQATIREKKERMSTSPREEGEKKTVEVHCQADPADASP